MHSLLPRYQEIATQLYLTRSHVPVFAPMIRTTLVMDWETTLHAQDRFSQQSCTVILIIGRLFELIVHKILSLI